MNPYQPGEDNQDPYEVGYKAGAASLAEQIASLKDELRQISTAIDDVRLDLTNTSAELIMEMKERLASRDAEVVSLTNQRDYEYVRAENAEQERDQLREQINVLRETLEKACIRIEEYGFDAGEHWKTGRNALASTPEQSLAEYRNKVIEECASVCDKRSMRKNDGNWTDFEWDSICGTNELAADEIRAMKEQP